MTNEFRFEEKTHRYYLNDKPLTGVTTVLSVIAKPALINWAANCAVDHILKHEEVKGAEVLFVPRNVLEEARKAHVRKKDTAADAGTLAHAEIERLVKESLGKTLAPCKSDNPAVQHFIDWATKHNVRFLASEKRMYSKEHWTAGTADLVIEIDGKKYVGDIKTSGAVYPEYFYQTAAYRMMLEEMGEIDFSGSIIIRVGKGDAFDEEKDVIMSEDFEEQKQAFLAALRLYRTTNSYQKANNSNAL